MGHWNRNTYTGRLFLAKGHEEIFVDVEQVLPHQLEGIRFLYRQFKKKNPGVILNDPTGYGKTRQVILFIKAMKHLLKKPLAILCSDHEKHHWLKHFQEFTDYGDGVLVEPPNLNLRKMSVCITTKKNVESLLKREWSILVVDDDTAINDVLKRSKINAEYKVWLTSVDMKTNLTAYWKILAWLYPKGENIEKIILEKKAKPGSLTEQILIEAAMEDVVLRRVNKDLTTFRNKDNDTEMLSSKNKNRGATKTKRSKIRKSDENSSMSDISVTSDDESVKIKRKVVENATNVETSIVEKIIQNTNILDNGGGLNHPVETDKIRRGVVKCNESVDIITDTCREQHTEMKMIEHESSEKCVSATKTNEICREVISEVVNMDTCSEQDTEMKDLENQSSEKCGTEAETSTNMEVEPTEMNISNTSNNCDKDSSTECEDNKESVTASKTVNIAKDVISPVKKETTNETNKNKSIVEYMKEMEEKAMRKFKGSVLDSIF